MRSAWSRAVVVLAAAGVAAAVGADPQPLPVRVERGVVYAAAGGEQQRMDVASPTGGGPYPAVVLFHGGAWRYGSRTDLSGPDKDWAVRPVPSVVEMIAAHGYVAVSAGYRLAPKHKFPAQLDDARAAVRFLRANAARFNLDPDRVGAVGFSAGAHLALLLGAGDPADRADPPAVKPSARVRCVVSYFGPTDLSLYAATPGIEEAYMIPLLGPECRTDPAVYRRASPIDQVSKDWPPTFLIHGTADLVVPVIHSERLLRALRDAGADADLLTVKGEGHGWGGAVATETTAAAVRFLDRHLKGKK